MIRAAKAGAATGIKADALIRDPTVGSRGSILQSHGSISRVPCHTTEKGPKKNSEIHENFRSFIRVVRTPNL